MRAVGSGCCLCWAFASLVLVARGEVLLGRVESTEDWKYLTKFCFLPNIGRLYYHIKYAQDKCCVNVRLYFDTNLQWPSLFKDKSKICYPNQEEVSQRNQFITLSPGNNLSGCQLIKSNATTLIDCEKEHIINSTNEGWWFIGLSNCKGSGLHLEYFLKMTNGNNYLTRHFPTNMHGIVGENLLLIFAFTGVLGVSFYYSLFLKERRLFHTTFKMLIASIGAEVVSRVLFCIHLGTFAQSGETNISILKLGRLTHVISYISLLSTLLLIAQGFTITRIRLRTINTVIMCFLISVFAILSTVFYSYENVDVDLGKLWMTSTAGYCLLTLQFGTAVWFSYMAYQTLQQHYEKYSFYLLFSIAFSIWFFAIPVISISPHLVNFTCKRERILNTISHLLQVCAYVVMLFLTRPGLTNTRFPYHIDVSRIALFGRSETSKEHEKNYQSINIISLTNIAARHNTNGSEMDKKTDQQEGAANVARAITPSSPIDSTFAWSKNNRLP